MEKKYTKKDMLAFAETCMLDLMLVEPEVGEYREISSLDITRIKKILLKHSARYIDYKGYRYWYEQKPANDRVDICLATSDPDKYCNGFYLYSTKDPSDGLPFVVVHTNNPSPKWMNNF